MVFIFKALFLKTLKFQLCRYFSLRPHDQSLWDKKQIVHNLCSYGLRVAILRFLCLSIFSMLKTLKIFKNRKKYYKKLFFFYEKNTYT